MATPTDRDKKEQAQERFVMNPAHKVIRARWALMSLAPDLRDLIEQARAANIPESLVAKVERGAKGVVTALYADGV